MGELKCPHCDGSLDDVVHGVVREAIAEAVFAGVKQDSRALLVTDTANR